MTPPADAQAVAEAKATPALILRTWEAAAVLGISDKAIRHRIARGQIPGVVHIGASVFIRRAALLGLISEGRGQSPGRNR